MEVRGVGPGSMLAVLAFCVWAPASALLCYNGTWRGPMAGPQRCVHAVSCTQHDGALCFVRAWSLRARPAWLVQRGCYSPPPGDPLPRSLVRPTRAMTCRTDRLAHGEYTLCLCAADWCNVVPRTTHSLTALPAAVLMLHRII